LTSLKFEETLVISR